MAWLNNPSFTVDDAINRGLDIYEIFFKDWGLPDSETSNEPTDAKNFCWPTFDGLSLRNSIAGLAIGPRSTVDRAWVSYNLQQAASGPDVVAGLATNRVREVTIDSPLIFSQPAGEGMTVSDDPMANMYLGRVPGDPTKLSGIGALAITPWDQNPNSLLIPSSAYYPALVNSTVTGDATLRQSYFDVNNVQRMFPSGGTWPTTPPTSVADFVGPFLHMIVYLKAAPAILPPMKRAPLKASNLLQIANGFGPFLHGVETPFAIIAVHGRKHVNVMMKATAAASFRIGALRVPSYGGLSFKFGSGRTDEEPVDSITGVAANTPVVTSPCSGGAYADYLMLYITPTAVDNPDIIYNVSAYD